MRPACSSCAVPWSGLTLACFVTTQTVAWPSLHAEGTAAGQAANPVIRGTINAPTHRRWCRLHDDAARARLLRPAQPPGQTSARLAACATTPTTPCARRCWAQLLGQHAARARLALRPGCPRRAPRGGQPSTALEDIASYYSGCQAETVATPATETRVCRQYSGATALSCARTLSVSISHQQLPAGRVVRPGGLRQRRTGRAVQARPAPRASASG